MAGVTCIIFPTIGGSAGSNWIRPTGLPHCRIAGGLHKNPVTASIADNWRKLSGENDWNGLLHPLDINFRRYIIHYGERAGAAGDTYNDKSKTNAFPGYAPDHLFSEVGLQNNNIFKYEVTNYLYARAQVDMLGWVLAGQNSWMGYVAVATDEGKAVLGRRDILISWRGTRTEMEWAEDFEAILVSASDVLGNAENPKVHEGFLSLYTSKSSDSPYNKTSARQQVLNEVRKLVAKFQDEEISITVAGHSLGAALATLNGMDIAANGYNKPTNQPNKACPVTVFAFACPRVGDDGFKRTYSNLNDLHILRVRNIGDFVPLLPTKGLFVDVGEELTVDNIHSPFLKDVSKHDLEVYLHLLAGIQEPQNDFKLVVHRSISLVNKSTDALKDDLKEKYDIPSNSWVPKNKTMVQRMMAPGCRRFMCQILPLRLRNESRLI